MVTGGDLGGVVPRGDSPLRAFPRVIEHVHRLAHPGHAHLVGLGQAAHAPGLVHLPGLHPPTRRGQRLDGHQPERLRVTPKRRHGMQAVGQRPMGFRVVAFPPPHVPGGMERVPGRRAVQPHFRQKGILHAVEALHAGAAAHNKGKPERFWGSVPASFLPELHVQPADSLGQLNTGLAAWLEDDDHRRVHSTTGETPVARWGTGGVAASDAGADPRRVPGGGGPSRGPDGPSPLAGPRGIVPEGLLQTSVQLHCDPHHPEVLTVRQQDTG